MTKYILLIVAIFLLLILQSGIINNLGFGPVGNLLLIFTAVVVILAGTKESFFVAISAGLMMDFVSGSRDGTMILCFLAIFGFTQIFITKMVPKDANLKILFAAIVVDTILFAVCFLVVNRIFTSFRVDTAVDFKFIIGRKLFLDLIANLIFVYPIYFFYESTQKLQKLIAG